MSASASEGRGPRQRNRRRSWLMIVIIVVAIATGVGIVLFFSVPVFFTPGGGIGEPINTEEGVGTTAEEQQPAIPN